MNADRFDVAVVGAGILGLAHAYHLGRRGLRVLVVERGDLAQGASIRNFGMIWPIGQPLGPLSRLAHRSRAIWGEVVHEAGLWHDRSGSLHLSYREDEEQVLREFTEAATADPEVSDLELLNPDEALRRAPLVNPVGLRLALFSPSEMCVDPREVIARLPGWLSSQFGVSFAFGKAAVCYDRPRLVAGDGSSWTADRLCVCTGDDFRALYPEVFHAAGLVRCKLQMLRAAPPANNRRIGPMLAAGLTLRHYRSFADCPSLPILRARVAREMPDYDRYGIHVMVSQNGRGELILGDSHEYGEAIDPFDKAEIENLILSYLKTFFDLPDLNVTARWHGVYAKHPTQAYLIDRPSDGVTAVTGVGGAGMTLSFGLAEQVVGEVIAEA